MKKAILFALPLMSLFAEEPVCKKCQMIREYNAAHPENNYKYYDDYIRDLEKKKAEGKEVDQKELSYHPKD